MTIGSFIKNVVEVVQVGFPTPVWTGIGLGVFFVSVLALVWGQHKDNEKQKENNTELRRQVGIPQQSSQKEPVREPTLKEEFRKAKVAWVLWYSGTRARADKVLDVPIPIRVLLLRPDENSEALLRIIKEAETPLDEILADIKFFTRRALQTAGRVQIGWHAQYIGYTLSIYDTSPHKGKDGILIPNSNEAWLVRSPLDPKVGAVERSRERIFNKGEDADKFQAYLEVFKDMWEIRIKVKLEDNEPVVSD